MIKQITNFSPCKHHDIVASSMVEKQDTTKSYIYFIFCKKIKFITGMCACVPSTWVIVIFSKLQKIQYITINNHLYPELRINKTDGTDPQD